MSRPLTQQDKVTAFKAATFGFARKYAKLGFPPTAESDLEAALHDAIGIFGGRGGPDELDITWQAAGLKICASWGEQLSYG